MKDSVPAGLLALALVLARAVAPLPSAAATDPGTRDSLVRSIEKGRSDTQAWLKSDSTSYLAAVRRLDFEERGSLTVGRAAGNDLRLDDSTLAARHLRVTVVGDSFQVEAVDPGATFTTAGAVTRSARLGPARIGVGRFLLRLSHQRFPALIVFDPRSPRFAEFKGLEYFPVDLAYRYVTPLVMNPHPDTVVILSTRGNQRRALRAGWFEFTVGKQRCRLEVDRLLEPGVGENDFAVFFKDLTSGKETYGMGRYVDPERLPDGRYALDFNLAYNPACAFSDDYNCPVPPRTNALKVAIRAGEKDAHYLHH
jgi:uncharacterized protein (DUF1684 family)